MQAYCLAPAGGSGDVQASWDAIRLRMTAEEVSMPRAPKAAWRTVNHSQKRATHFQEVCLSQRGALYRQP